MRGVSARGGSADRSGGTHYKAWRDEFTYTTQNLVPAVGAMIQAILVKRLSHDSGCYAAGIFERCGLTLQHECFILQPIEFVREDEETEKCGQRNGYPWFFLCSSFFRSPIAPGMADKIQSTIVQHYHPGALARRDVIQSNMVATGPL